MMNPAGAQDPKEQVPSLERMVERDAHCSDVLTQLVAGSSSDGGEADRPPAIERLAKS